MPPEQQATATTAPAAQPERRSAAAPIAAAIDLGWRVAALHALRPTTLAPPSPVTGDMLLNRTSLSASDRADLEVRAIAGVAERVGVPFDAAALQQLARAAGASPAGEQAFRTALASHHLEIAKQLWATDEAAGKAYELGNFLSDTWNRVVHPRIAPDPESELREIFSAVRVERMKVLLDDLQTRSDPVAAHTVGKHLDQWCKRIGETTIAPGTALEPVERQTIIWRQMLTGAKEPEAWLDNQARVDVRKELTRQLWKRWRGMAWLAPIVFALVAAAVLLYVRNQDTVQGLAGVLVAAAGAVGVQRASAVAVAKRGLENWGDLMYSRALSIVICRETSVLDELIPPPAPRRIVSARTRS